MIAACPGNHFCGCRPATLPEPDTQARLEELDEVEAMIDQARRTSRTAHWFIYDGLLNDVRARRAELG